MKTLSIVIPVFNEKNTIEDILKKINEIPIDKEIVIVDNCSDDGTVDILKKIENDCRARIIYHAENLGKGTSVRDGITAATGKYLIIQDADLEYDPKDYPSLLKPLLEDRADLVLGARFSEGHSGLFIHRQGNRFLTGLLNFLFCSRLNDYATCYKLAKRETFESLQLTARSFDIEVEIVCKALKKHLRVLEVPISYYARSYAQGKKIRWLDGIHAILTIIKFRVTRA